MISLSYMKKAIRTACMVALAALICGTVTAPAQDETPAEVESTSTKTSKKKELPAVAQALKKVKFVHGKANSAAKCYVYLQSASWCGPCCEELPKIVKLYPAMKKKKVELILVGHDHSNEKVLAFLKSFKAGFPGIYKSAEGVQDLPGLTLTDFVPSAIVVDDKGRVLHKGEGSDVLHWETLIKKKPVKTRK